LIKCVNHAISGDIRPDHVPEYGKQEIEWQGRSWRLLENKSQNKIDEWSVSRRCEEGPRLEGCHGSVVGIVCWVAYNKLRGKEEQAKVAGNPEKGSVKP